MEKIKRGFHTSESLWMPKHYGEVIAKKGGLDKTIIWRIEDVMDFIFPREFQPTQHKIACDFMKLVLERDKTDNKAIRGFAKENNYSCSTITNRVVPKLVRFGLVRNENDPSGKGRLIQGVKPVLSKSLAFANYLERIGFAWKLIVSEADKGKG